MALVYYRLSRAQVYCEMGTMVQNQERRAHGAISAGTFCPLVQYQQVLFDESRG